MKKHTLHMMGYALAPLLLILEATAGWAAQPEPGADHPLVGRFEASKIIKYEQINFDEYGLITGKVEHDPPDTDIVKALEGKITHIVYETGKNYSTLAVFRAYSDALAENGFKVLFECDDAGCGDDFNDASPGYRFSSSDFAFNDSDQRYLAAYLARPEGDVYVAIQTVRNTTDGGPTHDLIYTLVDVVEIEPQEVGVVVVKAEDMAAKIRAQGSIALYGIHFDTDSAAIRPESEPTLVQIAKLLKTQPELELLVVGHTDNRGSLEYNMDLSQRRARSVVDALVSRYGIAAARLAPHGVGFLAPVASNATKAGRAANRRVELVKR